MIRVLLADDHEIVRLGLRAILEEAQDIEVVGEVATAEAAIRGPSRRNRRHLDGPAFRRRY